MTNTTSFNDLLQHDGVSEEDSWYLKSIKILKCPVIDKSLINKVLTGDSLDPRMFYNAKDRGRFVTKGFAHNLHMSQQIEVHYNVFSIHT